MMQHQDLLADVVAVDREATRTSSSMASRKATATRRRGIARSFRAQGRTGGSPRPVRLRQDHDRCA